VTVEQSRLVRTSIPGPRSEQLHKRKLSAVASGVGTTLPIYVERAGGGIVEDVDGNRLIDFGSGIAVTSIGNSAPAVTQAVRKQVADFTHTCFMVTPYEEYVEVAERLNELTPGNHDKRSALFNSGAEAVENAIKVARHHTGRQAIVAFDHAYHGRTNLTMALTAKSMPYKNGLRPVRGRGLPSAHGLPLPMAHRSGVLRRRGIRSLYRSGARTGRRAERGGRHPRTHSGRGWFHRSTCRLSGRRRSMVPRERHCFHRRRDPDRVLPHR